MSSRFSVLLFYLARGWPVGSEPGSKAEIRQYSNFVDVMLGVNATVDRAPSAKFEEILHPKLELLAQDLIQPMFNYLFQLPWYLLEGESGLASGPEAKHAITALKRIVLAFAEQVHDTDILSMKIRTDRPRSHVSTIGLRKDGPLLGRLTSASTPSLSELRSSSAPASKRKSSDGDNEQVPDDEPAAKRQKSDNKTAKPVKHPKSGTAGPSSRPSRIASHKDMLPQLTVERMYKSVTSSRWWFSAGLGVRKNKVATTQVSRTSQTTTKDDLTEPAE
jgi:hypothetical protein